MTAELNAMGFEDMKAYHAKSDALYKLMAEVDEAAGDDLVGKHIRFQVADGYAEYIITKENKTTVSVVHIPVGDGYEFPGVVNGVLMKSVANRQVKMAKAWKAMSRDDEAETFYNNLKPGQIVHYHNGFKSYVRCVVTPDKQLFPMALVGNWSDLDLPKRQKDGEIYYPYHAKSILEKKLFKPHATTIWEFNSPEGVPPSEMPQISLELPPMSAAERESAAKYRILDRIRNLVQTDIDPDKAFEQLRIILDRI